MIIAKSNPLESLETHIGYLKEGFEEFCRLYGDKFTEREKELISLAIQYHDEGKRNYMFQKNLHEKLERDFKKDKKIEEIYRGITDGDHYPHGYLSPAFLDLEELKKKYDREEWKGLINAIINHHTRDTNIEAGDIKKIINGDLFLQKEKELSTSYTAYLYTERNSSDITEEAWLKYAIIKGILNKVDYWASSPKSVPIEISSSEAGENIATLVRKEFENNNWEIREVQKYMASKKGKNILVIASTGVGKTEASLLWLGGDKGFYTLPLKVSVNAIYDRIKNGYHYSVKKVNLMHSDALNYLLDSEQEEGYGKYKEKMLFPYPLTVCTIDQLFTFVYRYKGCEILLATLKYSKLIIDEIQAYSPEIIGKLIYGLKLISSVGGNFAIMTATMPPIFTYFMKKEKIPFEMAPERYYSPFEKRHKFALRESDFDYEEIFAESKEKQVLIICNTVAKSQNVYENLKKMGANPYLLHSRFMQKHRKMLEEKVLKFTDKEKGTSGIWISTQIVEASLDIDFDILYTEMPTADSLLQRMGRCYRKRNYEGEVANIRIHLTKNGISTNEHIENIYDKEIYERSVEYLWQYKGKFFSEEDKFNYIEQVYRTEDLIKSKFGNKIKKTIKECRDIVFAIYNKNEAKRKFRDISSISVIPEEIYNNLLQDGKMEELIKKSTDYNIKIDRKERIAANQELKNHSFSIEPGSTKKLLSEIPGLMYMAKINGEYEFDEETCQGRGFIKKNK